MASRRPKRRNRTTPRVRTRRRRNLDKFVPSGDSDFAKVARDFADYLVDHRKECNVEAQECEELARLVERFRKALVEAHSYSSSVRSRTDAKNAARKALENKYRTIGAKIRTDPAVDEEHKGKLRLIGLPNRRKSSTCPQLPPRLRFVNSMPGTNGDVGAGIGSGVHVLKFADDRSGSAKAGDGLMSKKRPDGATRIEVFVGFLPQGVSISELPQSPQEYQQMGFGWPLYLRSFARSPMEVRFPVPDQPMLIVYWARWAKESGEHGRFCKTCAARIEGWPKHRGSLPACSQVKVHSGARHALPGVSGVVGGRATFLLLGTPFAPTMVEDDVAEAAAEREACRALPPAA